MDFESYGGLIEMPDCSTHMRPYARPPKVCFSQHRDYTRIIQVGDIIRDQLFEYVDVQNGSSSLGSMYRRHGQWISTSRESFKGMEQAAFTSTRQSLIQASADITEVFSGSLQALNAGKDRIIHTKYTVQALHKQCLAAETFTDRP